MTSLRMTPGDQVFLKEGGTSFGAVRRVDPNAKELVIYIEGTGDQRVPMKAVGAAHDGKVVLKMSELPDEVRRAVMHAHDQEKPGF